MFEPVEQPAARPPVLSLLNSALTPDGAGGRWQGGYAFSPESCARGGVADPCDVSGREIDDHGDSQTATPFLAWTGQRCSSFGWSEADYQDRARRALLRCESAHIAAELWTGAQADASGWDHNPRLAQNTAHVVTAAPAAPVAALACLEQALADCGCGSRGMIHATRQVVTHWAGLSLVRREGSLLLTAFDTIVVPDSGYPGSGPGGEPAGNTQWAYATGMVTVRRGDIEIVPGSLAEAMTRDRNVVEFWAQRLASATWDECCHAAAELDVAVCAPAGS